jgi:CDP-glucose 4,6-dehydratase
MNGFGDQYRRRRVVITGHTGFKGSWLALWLHELGARVTGIALDPESSPNHWSLLGLPVDDLRIDIRDAPSLRQAVARASPQVVFHLAAQPLVGRSYREPIDTWSTNVMGTANLLEACREVPGLEAIVVVTTDKVYDNEEWPWGYRESDRLGGRDPYSASKAAAELVVASYRASFFDGANAPLVASARAGNVIGGGDWSQNRLVPDVVRALARGEPLEIRSPDATRPWQHVLDCLAGYLLLGERLLARDAACAAAWNFGPAEADNRSVRALLGMIKSRWPEVDWRADRSAHPREAGLLFLDSARARSQLGWTPVWPLEQAIDHTIDWYRAHGEGRLLSRAQIADYERARVARRGIVRS